MREDFVIFSTIVSYKSMLRHQVMFLWKQSKWTITETRPRLAARSSLLASDGSHETRSTARPTFILKIEIDAPECTETRVHVIPLGTLFWYRSFKCICAASLSPARADWRGDVARGFRIVYSTLASYFTFHGYDFNEIIVQRLTMFASVFVIILERNIFRTFHYSNT